MRIVTIAKSDGPGWDVSVADQRSNTVRGLRGAAPNLTLQQVIDCAAMAQAIDDVDTIVMVLAPEDHGAPHREAEYSDGEAEQRAHDARIMEV